MARLEGWDFVYDGEINKYNKYHGHGILRTTEGYTYEGEFENGTFCEGKMTDNYGVVYEGYFITGTLFGEGKITHPTALVYEGEFRHGELTEGKIVYPNGTLAIGKFVASRLTSGKIIYPDGIEYEGDFDKNGSLDGFGIEVYSGGTIYIGEFVGGVLVKGRKTYKDGRVLEGEFRDGFPCGVCKITLASGDSYEGIWESNILIIEGDCKDSYGKRIDSYGYIEMGRFKGGNLCLGTIIKPDGTRLEGEFNLDGEIDGEGKITYSSGLCEQGTFEENTLHGKGKRTYPDGSAEEGIFHYGHLI